MTPAERQRRYRERRRLGLRVYRVHLDDEQVQMLLQHRLIDERALHDPERFADLLGTGIELLLGRNA